MWEEQSYCGCTGPGFAIHSDICAPYVVNWGTEEQKHHWLPGLVSGEKIAALGMTEPSAGSDLQGMKTTAKREGDEWVINGSKVFITNGQMCDLLILACKTDPDAKKPAAGMSLFLVDTSLPGFSRGKNLSKIGMKAQVRFCFTALFLQSPIFAMSSSQCHFLNLEFNSHSDDHLLINTHPKNNR